MLLRTCRRAFSHTTGSRSAASRGNRKCRGVVQSHQPMGLGKETKALLSSLLWDPLNHAQEVPAQGVPTGWDKAPRLPARQPAHLCTLYWLIYFPRLLLLPEITYKKNCLHPKLHIRSELQEPKWMIYPFYPSIPLSIHPCYSIPF